MGIFSSGRLEKDLCRTWRFLLVWQESECEKRDDILTASTLFAWVFAILEILSGLAIAYSLAK